MCESTTKGGGGACVSPPTRGGGACTCAGAHEHREAVRCAKERVLNPNTSSTITINGDQPDT